MKTFKIYASEVVIYETREIQANTLEEASSQYLELWSGPNEPRVVDSNSFETGEEE